jgi:hypothetical protein
MRMDYFEIMKNITNDHAQKYLPNCSYCGGVVTPQEVSQGTAAVNTVRMPDGKEIRNYEHLECVQAIEEGYKSGAW